MIFSAPMVRALLAARKTQTRRELKNVPPPGSDTIHASNVTGPRFTRLKPAPYLDSYCGEPRTPTNPRGMSTLWCWWTRDNRMGPEFKISWKPGDRLWVRETWTATGTGLWTIAHARARIARDQRIFFAADGGGGPWWQSIHMPREFSRLTLIVTDVRVQRLHDISHEDALAEGMNGGIGPGYDSAAHQYMLLWNAVHGHDAWALNPWVVALRFRVVKANIDSQEAKAA